MTVTGEHLAILRLAHSCRQTERAAAQEGLALAVTPPERFTVGLVGPVDGGKTTLAQMLLGVSPAAAGIDPAVIARLADLRLAVEYHDGPAARLESVFRGGITSDFLRRDFHPGHLDHQELIRLRVTAPFAMLREWDLRVIDYPSITEQTDLTDQLYHGLTEPMVGILYVTHSRGRTGADLLAIEHLRGRPLVAVESIRQSELLPSRSEFTLTPVSGLAFPYVLQLLPYRTRQGAEAPDANARHLLGMCLSALRTQSMPDGAAAMLGRQLGRARDDLRQGLADRLDGVHAAARATDPQTRLQAVAGLLSLAQDAQRLASLDSMLSTAANFAEHAAIWPAHALRTVLRDRLTLTLAQYTVETGTQRPQQVPPHAGSGGGGPAGQHTTVPAEPLLDEEDQIVAEFGARYAQNRRSLIALLGGLQSAEDVQLLPGELTMIDNLRRQVVTNKLQLAMLGQFSSGKSSIINALLDVPVNDRASDLLPTSVRVETATVNSVEYAPQPTVDNPTWLSTAELTFLSPTEHKDGLKYAKKVHPEELRAVYTWLENGDVQLKECEFIVERAGAGDIGPAPEHLRNDRQQGYQAFIRLWRDLRMPQLSHPYAYLEVDAGPNDLKIGQGLIATGVRIHGFVRPEAAGWHNGLRLAEAFALAQRPEIALRVERLHIGHHHHLLKHITFLDTPGTDAPIPHHRKVARGVIKDDNCPVIYCFNAHFASGGEDEANLRAIWTRAAAVDLTRFFFVITRAGDFPDPRQAAEIHASVVRCLANVGIRGVRVYFTEVVNEQNADFHDLVADINRFIQKNRQPKLYEWTSHAHSVVGTVLDRIDGMLRQQAEAADERERRQRALQADLATVGCIRVELDTSDSWGAAWTRRRVAESTAHHRAELDAIISQLTTKASFAGAEQRLETQIDELNDATKLAVSRNCAASLAALRTHIAGALPGRTIRPATPVFAGNPYRSADVLETTRNVTWRGFWSKVKGWFKEVDWSQDIVDNRTRIAKAWDRSRADGDTQAGQAQELFFSDLRQQVDLIIEDLAEQHRASSTLDADELAKLRARRAEVERWVGRISALLRTLEASV